MTADATVLVTGATGLVGGALVRDLVADGVPVRALVRESSRVAALNRLGVELFVGDVTDPRSLSVAAEGVDTVYHCAAFVGDWGPEHEFREVNVDGTAHVVEAAVAAGVRRLVHLSSIVVYGLDPRPEMAEWLDYEYVGDPYFDTKIDAEKTVFAAANDLEVAAIRPGVIYGPGDRHFLPRLVPIMQRLPLPRMLGLDAIANLAYVKNVVALCRVLAAHERAPGEAFNCIDAEPMRMVNALRLIATKTGGRQPRGAALPQAMDAAAVAFESVWKWLDIPSPPPLTRFAVDGAKLVRPYSMEKARWLLDFVPPYAMRDGLIEALREMGLTAEDAGDEWNPEWSDEE